MFVMLVLSTEVFNGRRLLFIALIARLLFIAQISIYWITQYAYSLNCDLSIGLRYLPFEQLSLGFKHPEIETVWVDV